MKPLSLVVACCCTCLLQAQNTDTLQLPVQPQGGIQELALEFYRIDFSKEQRARIKDVELEFIFKVDEKGKAVLEEVNGINDPDILDSLKNRSRTLPAFQPRTRNGVPEPSLYFMKLVFPSYTMTETTAGWMQSMAYSEAKLEDFEYINLSGERLDLVFGGMINQFSGNPAKHLGRGGGMKIDITYTAKNTFVYGMSMNFYGNRLKTPYPLSTSREQFKAPPTLLIGGVFGKWFKSTLVQLEVGYAVQNITERLNDNDPEWIQLRGWSPGVAIHFPVKFGREKPYYYYGSPTLLVHHLNFHSAVRPIFLSLDAATGIMIEGGVSYRMTNKSVSGYKLKNRK